MPSIRDAMLASLVDSLHERDILSSASSTATSIKSTFSSWDSCMAKTYCKWPVIAAIVVAGLVVLSVIWCIVRCACCGLSCCCSCFSCLRCCGSCCGACDNPRGNKKKHLDNDYFKPNEDHGYHSQPPMMTRAFGGPAPPPPSYAQFDVGPNGHAIAPRAVNDDALPPMPSWDTSSKKHVATAEEDDMELKEMDLATRPLISSNTPVSSSGPSHLPSPYHESHGYSANEGKDQDWHDNRAENSTQHRLHMTNTVSSPVQHTPYTTREEVSSPFMRPDNRSTGSGLYNPHGFHNAGHGGYTSPGTSPVSTVYGRPVPHTTQMPSTAPQFDHSQHTRYAQSDWPAVANSPVALNGQTHSYTNSPNYPIPAENTQQPWRQNQSAPYEHNNALRAPVPQRVPVIIAEQRFGDVDNLSGSASRQFKHV